jgi:hypothetical protein
MENNYWYYNALIDTSSEELERLLEYEIWMFRETCNHLINLDQKTKFERNLLLESLATHTRILIDFFYGDKNDKKYPNDLIAQDLLPQNKDWKSIKPPLTQVLKDAKEKANKQLAHLSLWRIKLERDKKKGWDSWREIKEDLEKVIKKFEEFKKIE